MPDGQSFFNTEKNIPFTEYDLSKDIAKKGRGDKEKPAKWSVPVIEVDDETMIGFDEGQLSKMLGI